MKIRTRIKRIPAPNRRTVGAVVMGFNFNPQHYFIPQYKCIFFWLTMRDEILDLSLKRNSVYESKICYSLSDAREVVAMFIKNNTRAAKNTNDDTVSIIDDTVHFIPD